MEAETIIKINAVIETLNYKQQNIAKKLMINTDKYTIYTSVDDKGIEDLFIKDNKSGKINNFIGFVKSLCNCG